MTILVQKKHMLYKHYKYNIQIKSNSLKIYKVHNFHIVSNYHVFFEKFSLLIKNM